MSYRKINKLFTTIIFRLINEIAEQEHVQITNQVVEHFNLYLSDKKIKQMIKCGVEFFDIGYNSRNSIIHANLKIFKHITENLSVITRENKITYHYVHENEHINLCNNLAMYKIYTILYKTL
jgi:hypothetical protein